jgi:hypothetical protein
MGLHEGWVMSAPGRPECLPLWQYMLNNAENHWREFQSLLYWASPSGVPVLCVAFLQAVLQAALHTIHRAQILPSSFQDQQKPYAPFDGGCLQQEIARHEWSNYNAEA